MDSFRVIIMSKLLFYGLVLIERDGESYTRKGVPFEGGLRATTEERLYVHGRLDRAVEDAWTRAIEHSYNSADEIRIRLYGIPEECVKTVESLYRRHERNEIKTFTEGERQLINILETISPKNRPNVKRIDLMKSFECYDIIRGSEPLRFIEIQFDDEDEFHFPENVQEAFEEVV